MVILYTFRDCSRKVCMSRPATNPVVFAIYIYRKSRMTRKFIIRDIAHLACSSQHPITLSRCGLPVVTVNTTAVCLDISWTSMDTAGGTRPAPHHLLSLLDPRFGPSCNGWKFASFPDQERQMKTNTHIWPSYHIQLSPARVVRNSYSAVCRPPQQNTS